MATPVTCYVDEKTKKRWIQHVEKTRPRYNSLSHMVEVNTEYGIEADNYPLNRAIGATGPQKLKQK